MHSYNWFQNLLTFSVLVKHKTVSKLTSFNEIGSENVSFDFQIHPVPWQIHLAIFFISKHDFVILFDVLYANISILTLKAAFWSVTSQLDM